ncbi:ankyrin repeat domain-containing protein 26-like isoform X4 [Monodelphis domestica]|uniref:ankyrin repeat domain-containing protein 26-like isoform X4 n=1 Tax=Monodelphis domestica TaxID=13616 RepID=UPI0024E1DC65|nr:ankyrin repeat domain-containing protein 26-like isoform X4 [Monodelphis domestica]
MKKLFHFRKKTQPEACVPIPARRDVGVSGESAEEAYRIRKKDVGKLHQAASTGDCPEVQWLLLVKGKDINELDQFNRTALHLACAAGYPDVVSLLVERHCKLDVCDSNHRTPLMKAVQCQQEECVSILLLHGADPNMVDESSSSALHYAASGYSTAIAVKLLEWKADIEAKDGHGFTPLLLAVKNHHEEMVDLFLKNGANVNGCDDCRRTALMIALSSNSTPTSLIKLILQYDVDLSCQDYFGRTIKDYPYSSHAKVHRELVLQYVKSKLNEPCVAEISSPDVTSDISFTSGGPVLDKKVAEQNSPEVSRSRFSDKPGLDDSWSSSDEELDFSIQNPPKLNLKKLITATPQIRRIKDEKSSTVKTELRTCLSHNQTDNEKEDVTDSLLHPSSQAQYSLHPAHLSPGTFSMPVQKLSAPVDSNKRVSENLPKGSTRQKSAATTPTMKEVFSSGQLEDYTEKYHKLQFTQPTLEIKDSFTNQETKKGIKKKEKSDPGHRVVRNPGVSPKRWGFSKAEVSPITLSLPLDAVALGHKQWLRPALSSRASPSTSLKSVTSRTSKHVHFDVVEESSSEVSISRFSDKPGPDDSWSTSDEELDFSIQKPPDLNLKKLINASQQIRRIIDEKSSSVNTELRIFLGHNHSDNETDVTDSLPQPSSQIQYSLNPVHPSPGTFSMSVRKVSAPMDINKEELMDTEEEPKNDGMLMVNNATREQRHDETPNSPSELGAHSMSQKCAVRKDLMSAFTGGEEEDAESPWDSEVEEQKNKPQHNVMETMEEENGVKLTEDKMVVNVNELVFSVKNNQHTKSEGNKIPVEEIQKMSIDCSTEISALVKNQLKW